MSRDEIIDELKEDVAFLQAVCRKKHDSIAHLRVLIEQLLDIAVADECPNCGTGYDVEESTATCVECSGARAAIAEAKEISLAAKCACDKGPAAACRFSKSNRRGGMGRGL